MGCDMTCFQDDFFREEVREGYSVSELNKIVMAAQMEMFCELRKLLDKYGLKYYVDCGTLLGAVRHKGYIPWDDDLDISMPRKDYMFLLEHADEVSDGLFIRSIYNSDTYGTFHAVLTHKAEKLKWDDERMEKYSGCPFICFIDIFPWDNMPQDHQKFIELKRIYSVAYKLANIGRLTKDNYSKAFLEQVDILKKEVKESFQKEINIDENLKLDRYLYALTDGIAQAYNDIDTGMVEYAPNLVMISENKPRQSVWSKTLKEMPFEGMIVPAPAMYDKVLENQYGSDYMIPIRFKSAHGYPFYRSEVQVLIDGDTGDIIPDYIVQPSIDDIPEEIRSYLLDEEGQLKKIIIYGLSAADIVCNGSCAIKTIRNYLSGFGTKENEIVVCFAPANIIAFLDKCNLMLRKEYEKLISDISEMDNVIFDNAPTAGELRAFIAICDEYVGDECRLAEWCRRQEVPVTIQIYQPEMNSPKDILH